MNVAGELEAYGPIALDGTRGAKDRLELHFVGDTRAPLIVLLGAVACLLLIACANVATLLLARASARATEIGVRMALGAARGRVAMQLFIESTMLAVAGGVVGVLLSFWATHAIVAMRLESIPTLADISLDSRVLMVSVVAVVVAAAALLVSSPSAMTLPGSAPALLSSVVPGMSCEASKMLFGWGNGTKLKLKTRFWLDGIVSARVAVHVTVVTDGPGAVQE